MPSCNNGRNYLTGILVLICGQYLSLDSFHQTSPLNSCCGCWCFITKRYRFGLARHLVLDLWASSKPVRRPIIELELSLFISSHIALSRISNSSIQRDSFFGLQLTINKDWVPSVFFVFFFLSALLFFNVAGQHEDSKPGRDKSILALIC